MKKNSVSLFIAVVIIILQFNLQIPASALDTSLLHGVALGDSATELLYSASDGKDVSYTTQISSFLKSRDIASDFTNLTVNGLTAQTLLAQLSKVDVAAELRSSDVITLNIGATDIFVPFIEIVKQELAALNITDMSKASVPSLMAFAGKKLTEQQISSLKNDVALFTQNFLKVIEVIHILSPNAELFVNTLYNPIPSVLSIRESAETLILLMNKFIIDNSLSGNYTVADIYTAYKNSPDVVVNFDISSGSFDTRPNAAGRSLIAKTVASKIADIIVTNNADKATAVHMTRGEAISEIMKLISPYLPVSGNADTGNTERFVDVAPNHKNFDAIMKAKACKIIFGSGDSVFKPGEIMTREDFAVIIVRISDIIKKSKGIKTPEKSYLSLPSSDFDNVSDYARESVTKAISLGLITPSKGKINPQSGVTAEFIKNALMIVVI